MTSRSRALVLVVLGLLLVPSRHVAAQVVFERAGFRLTSIGERVTVSGRVLDASRRPVPSSSIRWRVADPSIATVTPQGVLVSRKVGNTKLWAVTGEDSASALVLVDQWAAKFDFLPSIVRLNARGAKERLRVIVRDAGGYPVANQTRRPCRSLNNAVATLDPNGDVTAVANGVTYIRCADRGIADSVRVEVRRRPTRAVIADKDNLARRVLGETFTLRITATDATGDVIQNPPTTWASLNPTIVSVDPLSGAARTVGPGTARIVAQAGEATDTVSVGVAPAAGLPVPSNVDAIADASTAPRVPTVKVESAYPFLGDTAEIRVTVRDPSGIEIPTASVRLESSDSTIFQVISRRRIIAKNNGFAYVRVHFGETVDSGQVSVRLRPSASLAASTGADAARPFVRPTYNVDSLNAVYQTSRDSINRKIFDSTRVRGLKLPWLMISGAVAGGPASHSFSDSTGREQRSGFVYGGIAELRLFRYAKLSGEFRTGTLTSSGATGTELGLTEAGATLTAQASDAFQVGGSWTLRATREGTSAAPLAIQQWTLPRLFMSVRPAFIGGSVRTLMGLNALLPGATYTGYLDAQNNQVNPEPFSLGGEAGLEFSTGGFRIGLIYNVESFRFAKIGTSERRDQFSTLRLRAGWQYSN